MKIIHYINKNKSGVRQGCAYLADQINFYSKAILPEFNIMAKSWQYQIHRRHCVDGKHKRTPTGH